MKVAIIGCGLIGQKRAMALKPGCLIACTDLIYEKALQLAKHFPNCDALTEWREVIDHPEVQVVIIATVHAVLAEIAMAAISNGKHVFLEKPGARNALELQPLISAAEKERVLVRVGFNHRYHRAFRKAKELIVAEKLGELMFIRARYGHGGRLGYEKEWRANPALAGGGELIDQGIHLIDLARWFLGDFNEVYGQVRTYFWDMPVEDNGFMLLKTSQKKTAFLHASCTEWKNIFSFEIYGKQGKIDINGLGGSYGTERLSFYKMGEQMGPPETIIWEYPMVDNSWQVELDEFFEDISLNRHPSANLKDAYAALQIVENIYKNSTL